MRLPSGITPKNNRLRGLGSHVVPGKSVFLAAAVAPPLQKQRQTVLMPSRNSHGLSRAHNGNRRPVAGPVSNPLVDRHLHDHVGKRRACPPGDGGGIPLFLDSGYLELVLGKPVFEVC